MRILGLSAYYHDSAAALIVDGRIVAAAQEERFSRQKHDSGFPSEAVRYCLREGGCDLADVDLVAFYDKPFLKFERLLETYLSFAPRGFRSFRMAMPIWIREKLFLKGLLVRELKRLEGGDRWNREILFAEHHESHAASAFFPSPFEEAAILTVDGVGEWATTAASVGSGGSITPYREIRFPHSLGLLYSAFTYYLGFRVNSGEYKIMGLAPYGTPRYADSIRQKLIDVKADGSFRLDQRYFDYCTGLQMTSGAFHELFGGRPRRPEEPLEQRHMDLAASVQKVTEDVLLLLARGLAAETGLRNLCMAGGVALNCVANGEILRDGCFERMWIQPAAGDAGGALGAALLAHHRFAGAPRTAGRRADAMSGSYLGPAWDQAEIESRLAAAGARFTSVGDGEVVERTARAIAGGDAVGWFQGRMEYGPRALGGRSILGDPRSPTMQSLLNLKVKYRESFRPFAPSVLVEKAAEWFQLDVESPYMLLVAEVVDEIRTEVTPEQRALFGIDLLNVPRSSIPAVTHVDYSARVQTVDRTTNPRYHALIRQFEELTGCPVVVNTSFNVRGEPIVCTPEDAFRCFMATEMDLLSIGNCILRKEEQDPTLKVDPREIAEPD